MLVFQSPLLTCQSGDIDSSTSLFSHFLLFLRAAPAAAVATPGRTTPPLFLPPRKWARLLPPQLFPWLLLPPLRLRVLVTRLMPLLMRLPPLRLLLPPLLFLADLLLLALEGVLGKILYKNVHTLHLPVFLEVPTLQAGTWSPSSLEVALTGAGIFPARASPFRVRGTENNTPLCLRNCQGKQIKYCWKNNTIAFACTHFRPQRESLKRRPP